MKKNAFRVNRGNIHMYMYLYDYINVAFKSRFEISVFEHLFSDLSFAWTRPYMMNNMMYMNVGHGMAYGHFRFLDWTIPRDFRTQSVGLTMQSGSDGFWHIKKKHGKQFGNTL